MQVTASPTTVNPVPPPPHKHAQHSSPHKVDPGFTPVIGQRGAQGLEGLTQWSATLAMEETVHTGQTGSQVTATRTRDAFPPMGNVLQKVLGDRVVPVNGCGLQ